MVAFSHPALAIISMIVISVLKLSGVLLDSDGSSILHLTSVLGKI